MLSFVHTIKAKAIPTLNNVKYFSCRYNVTQNLQSVTPPTLLADRTRIPVESNWTVYPETLIFRGTFIQNAFEPYTSSYRPH